MGQDLQNPLNALSIDTEEWFCVSGFESVIDRADWPRLESRVEVPTRRILEILAAHEVRATFFVLGWIAERHRELVAEIARQGHEVACHGYDHRLVYDLEPEEFRSDLRRALDALSRATAERCVGYRAPSFSLRRNMDWAWEILDDAGIEYDSSVFPIAHDRYGEPDAPRFPYRFDRGSASIVEFPPSTIRAMSRNIPVAGGGYFRLYPWPVTRWAIRRINREGHPAVVYLHPWEFDPDHPRPPAGRLTLLRHRVGLGSVGAKLDRMLSEFRFGSMRDALDGAGFAGSPTPGATLA